MWNRRRPFRCGDPVVYLVTKESTDPGPRAHDVRPSRFGETYRYVVPKYWTVASQLANGELLLVTRRGKMRRVNATDFRLRHARWWERLVYGSRFPRIESLLRNGVITPQSLSGQTADDGTGGESTTDRADSAPTALPGSLGRVESALSGRHSR